ncbi:MAG: DUF6952 family protein [Bacteroidia bacterium]|jgi:hypothetical protein
MKLPVIRSLAEKHTIEELKFAESSILNEEKPPFEVPGDDEGEQLTHVISAIAIKEDMAANGVELRVALRNYAERVRKSIS